MLNPKLKLNPKIFNTDVEQTSTRKGFGIGLLKAGEENKNVVALCADLVESTQINMFAEKFEFAKGYKIPKCKTLADFRAAVESLPLNDSPEAFGLHSNADITYQTNTSDEILTTITNIQPKDSGGGSGETRERQETEHQQTQGAQVSRQLRRARLPDKNSPWRAVPRQRQ